LFTDIFLWVTSAPSIIIIAPRALLEKIEIPWPRFEPTILRSWVRRSACYAINASLWNALHYGIYYMSRWYCNSWQLGRRRAGQLRFGFVAVLVGLIVYSKLIHIPNKKYENDVYIKIRQFFFVVKLYLNMAFLLLKISQTWYTSYTRYKCSFLLFCSRSCQISNIKFIVRSQYFKKFEQKNSRLRHFLKNINA
jgi:cytochrome c oxidase assembly factor CtaG